jgi:hypothetical protein
MATQKTTEWRWAGQYEGVGRTYPSREVAEENIPGLQRMYSGPEFSAAEYRVAPCTDPYFDEGRWIIEYRIVAR